VVLLPARSLPWQARGQTGTHFFWLFWLDRAPPRCSRLWSQRGPFNGVHRPEPPKATSNTGNSACGAAGSPCG